MINLVVNWKMNLFTSLLFMAALHSSMEQTNLYAAWWLDQKVLQERHRQTVKREVGLPDWCVRLHSILFCLRSPLKTGGKSIISMLSAVLLACGASCMLLGCLLMKCRMDREGAGPASLRHWFAVLKGNSMTVGIGVVIAAWPNAAMEPACESVMRMPPGTQELLRAPIENADVERILGTDNPAMENPGESLETPVRQISEIKGNKRACGKKIHYAAGTRRQMRKFHGSLSEKDRRRYAGVEALKLGYGGIAYVADLLGCDRKTVSKGMRELKGLSRRHADRCRTRKKGGGRKPYTRSERLAHIDGAFLEVLSDSTAGDPMREDVIWTNLTPGDICRILRDRGIEASRTVVGHLLEKHGYRRRQILKKETMGSTPTRNQQFGIIGRLRESYRNSPNPIVSIDTKKKEHIGNFYRSGRLYAKEPVRSYDHDYPSFAQGTIIPRGLYDMKRNKGFIHLGTSHDTSEFACDCLKDWWLRHGRRDYPDADSILVFCDSGGSNSCRHYIFKQDIRNLSDEIGVEIRIAHYPPYCSKYNPIEHRLFPHVTRACQGVVFESVELVKSLMERTQTRTGLSVEVSVMDRIYETERKASDEFRQNMGILFDETLPRLNYRVLPNGEVI